MRTHRFRCVRLHIENLGFASGDSSDVLSAWKIAVQLDAITGRFFERNGVKAGGLGCMQ